MSAGLTCPTCGCADLRAWMTRNSGNTRKRVKICRHCGQRVQTIETIVGKLSNTGRKPQDSKNKDCNR